MQNLLAKTVQGGLLHATKFADVASLKGVFKNNLLSQFDKTAPKENARRCLLLFLTSISTADFAIKGI